VYAGDREKAPAAAKKAREEEIGRVKTMKKAGPGDVIRRVNCKCWMAGSL